MAADSTSPADRVKGLLCSFLRNVASDEEASPSASVDSSRPTSSKTETSAERSPIKLRSRDAFFARIETYWPSRWFAKSSALSPLVCSKYGWENVDEDLLKCVSCGAHLSGELPDPSKDTFEDCCSALRESLLSAHKKLCYWSTNPCPDSFLQVPHFNYSEVRNETRQNYKHFLERIQTVPTLDYSSLNKWGFCEGNIKELAQKLALSKDSATPSAASAALAVTGWMTSRNSDVIVCSHCRRQVGLWNFQSESRAVSNGGSENGHSAGSDGANSDGDTGAEPLAKKRRCSSEETAKALDPVEEHRHWCPWITNQDGAIPTPPEDPRELWSSVESSERADSGADAASVHPGAGDRSSPGEGGGVKQGAGGGKEVSGARTSVQSAGGEKGEVEGRARAATDLADTPGWLRTVKVIISEGGSPGEHCSLRNLRQNSVTDGLRSIRRLLKDWSSPLPKSN